MKPGSIEVREILPFMRQTALPNLEPFCPVSSLKNALEMVTCALYERCISGGGAYDRVLGNVKYVLTTFKLSCTV